MAVNPQERYETPMETRTLANGRMVYRSLRPKRYENDPLRDVEILSTLGTRMDKLSNEFFGTSLSWWKIALANGKVDGSLYFKPGTKIVIPVK